MIKLKSKVGAPIKKKRQAATPIKKKLKTVAPIKNRTKYEYWVEFDVLGEEEVRAKLEGGKYGGGRLDAAVEWLGNKETAEKLEKKRDAQVKTALRAAKISQFAATITGIAAIVIGVAALYFYFS